MMKILSETAKAIRKQNRALRGQGKKRCNCCLKIKPLQDFYYSLERNIYTPKCRKCSVADNVARCKLNRAKINEQRRNLPAVKKAMNNRRISEWRKRSGMVNMTLLILPQDRIAIKAAAKAAGMSLKEFVLFRCLNRQ